MIIREGENCWVKTRADRVAFLVDGADYFEAFVLAARQARHTLYIAGWDFDSRLLLNRRGKLPGDIPPLGTFINQLAEERPGLQIFILSWDFPLIYLRERQWLPMIHFENRRIHFHLDDQHPMGASHHQKLVVVDDCIAFCGGFDLTNSRWDTRAHHPDDERRVDSSGTSYSPFHDVQAAVAGETARALGRLFRYRWRCATGEKAPAPPKQNGTPWPTGLPVDIEACTVGVARTLPAFKSQEPVREVERLHTDAIQSAADSIYIETQYLTAQTICGHLGRRLAESQGPEVVIIMPSKASGWLEQSTMDALRRRNLELLARQDRHRRLGVFWPSVGKESLPIYVHSKLLIADDRLAIVGSANLSNRSMGFDSECCLAVEAGPGSRTAEALEHFRNDLLAEHLGRSAAEVADAFGHERSLRRVIERMGRPDRRLEPLDMEAAPIVDGTAWVPDRSFLDPEEPFEFDQLMDGFANASKPRSRARRAAKVAAILVVLFGIAAVWRWTPLNQWITVDRLAQWGGFFENTTTRMAVVAGGFILGGLIFVPVTLMIGATALLLPSWQGALTAMAGCVLSAWATYWVGRKLGKPAVRRLAGDRLSRLTTYLSRQGVLAVILVRNIPVAPFSIVNIVAGTTHLKQTDFLLGTAIGMLPGILAITVFTGRVLQVFKDPSWSNILVAAAVAVLVGFGLWLLRKRLRTKTES